VETRASDISGFRLPTWEEVLSREYEPWNREHFVIDTADCKVDESVRVIRELLGNWESLSLPAK